MTPSPARRLALLLLAALLAAGALPAAGQVTRPDLAAEGLRLAGPTPEWAGSNATETRIEVNVVNHGPTAATFTVAYYWNTVDPGSYLKGDATSSTDSSHEPLMPGATAVHGIDWTPMDGQEGEGSIIALVSPEQDGVPTNNRATLPIQVPVHDIRFEAPSNDTAIRLGETRYLHVRATNLGTSAEQLSTNAFWSVSTPLQAAIEPSSLSLAPNAVADLFLYVTRPADAASVPPTAYRIALRNDSAPSWSPSVLTPAFTGADKPLGAGELATSLQAPAAPGPLAPGTPFDLAFIVSNPGTAPDSFRMAATGPHGWGAAASPQHVALDPGATAVVHVAGAVAPGAEPGALEDVVLNAVSERAAAGSASGKVSLRVSGALILPPTVTLPETAYQGQPVDVTVEVRNGGSRVSEPGNVTLVAARPVPGLPASKAVPALEPGARTQVTFTFTAARSEPVLRHAAFAVLDRDGDGKAGPGEAIYLAVRPDAASDGFVHPEGGGKVTASDVRINATTGAPGTRPLAGSSDLAAGPLAKLPPPLCLDADADGRCAPGEPLYLDTGAPFGVASPGDIRLEASGKSPAGSRVAPVEPETGLALVPGPTNASLAFADGNGNGAFDPSEAPFLDLDLDGAAGPGDLRLTPLTDPRGEVLEPFGSRLAAGDRDDGTRLRPLVLSEIDGILGPLRLDAAWAPADGQGAAVPADAATLFVRTAALNVTPPAGFQASPGETLELGVPPRAFKVTNGGNAAERIALRATSGGGNLTLKGADHLLLAAGESRTVPVVALLPASMPDGSVELRLEAWLEDHTETAVQAVALVELRDLTPPAAAFEGLRPVWTTERALPLTVSASDDVGVRAVNVTAAPAGESGATGSTVALERGPDGLWTGELRLPAGNYTLTADASDAAGRHGRAGPAALAIALVPPPRLVRMVPDDGAIVARDEPLVAVFEDPLGLAEATVRVDGGAPRTLLPEADGATIRGTLGDLPAGRHRIDLSVANVAGSVWNGTLQVYAAGTAPGTSAPARESPLLGASWALLALALLAARRRRA